MRKELASMEEGGLRFEVEARDRYQDAAASDPVLSTLDESDFDELWLIALDGGEGLTAADCAGIARFRRRGGGILSTRDHQDVGASLCRLAGGAAHHFQTRNPEPDVARRAPDDDETPSIPWPNYTPAATATPRRSSRPSRCTTSCAAPTHPPGGSSSSRPTRTKAP